MYNRSFLIFAFLAALHPISCFLELNSVDGRGKCCDNEPTSLLREAKPLYGSQRFWQISAQDNRLNLNRDHLKNKHHEVEPAVFRRSTAERRVSYSRSETDIRRLSRVPSRHQMRRAETRESERRQRSFTGVERIAHRTTSRDISRLERDGVQDNRGISTRATDEQNEISMDSRYVSRNRGAHSEFRNKENRETRYLLQRARNDVVYGDRRDQQNQLSRPSPSLERHNRGARVETRHKVIQNELKPNRERDSVRDTDEGMSRSIDRRVKKVRGRTELHHELKQNDFSLTRERDSTHRISRFIERRDHKVRDRTEARDDFHRSELILSRLDYSHGHVSRGSRETTNEIRVRDISRRSRVAVHTNQIMIREKRSIERSPSESSNGNQDMDHRQAAEMPNEQRVLISRQDTRVRMKSSIAHRSLNSNERRATREMANNRVQRSRSESRLTNQGVSGKNFLHIRMQERDMRERHFRSRSLHMDIERQSVDRCEKEHSANRDRDERRISRIYARSFLEEEGRHFVDSVDRVMIRGDSRLNIRAHRSSHDRNLRQTENISQRERDTVILTRDDVRDARFNGRVNRKSLDENRHLSFDLRERASADRIYNDRSHSQINFREVQAVRDEVERHNFRRDTVINELQNSEQRNRHVSRTKRIRDIRQESGEQRSAESTERSGDIRFKRREVRRSIRYDDRESRAFDRRERIISESHLVERSEGFSISRELHRDVKINTGKENRISKNLQRDNYRFRSDVRFTDSHDSFVLRHKTQGNENISTLNWQYLFYTLQAIYLCSIFAKALSKDVTGNKTRATMRCGCGACGGSASHKMLKIVGREPSARPRTASHRCPAQVHESAYWYLLWRTGPFQSLLKVD